MFPVCSYGKMANTRAHKLRFSVAYALFRLKIADRKGRTLTEAERNAIADHVVATLRPDIILR